MRGQPEPQKVASVRSYEGAVLEVFLKGLGHSLCMERGKREDRDGEER